MVSDGTSTWQQRGVVRAAAELSIPIVALQHGGGMGFLSDEDMSIRAPGEMLDDVGLYLAWGEGVLEEYCATTSVPAAIREPPALRAIFERRGGGRVGRAPAERTLLFAPTNLTGNWRRGPASDPPDTANYRLQQRVIAAVLDQPGTRIVAALPGAGHAVNPLGRWAGDRAGCEVRRGGFRELLEASDGVIVSWPFTALLEAVASDRPVLCIADRRTVEFRASALELLRRRAAVVTDLNELERGIAGFVHQLDQPAPLDDEFLRRYGLGGDRGIDASRIDELITPRRTSLSRV